MNRIILHIDMDAFFAAIEEREKPWLKGKPIAVGADPKNGKGRGVISTANYAARKYGIHSAQPISYAWQLAESAKRRGEPEVIFLTGSYRKYSEVSAGIMEYLRTITPLVEQVSVDEGYLQLTTDNQQLRTRAEQKANLWKQAEEKAKEIKAEILKREKLTCSIGIGPNKLIAKIASDHKKPNGLTVVHREEVQSFLDPKNIRVIPGIGPKAEIALNRLNVKTIKDLRAIAKEKLVELFGKWGARIYEKARGIDESIIETASEAKSISEQETYEHDTLDPNFLLRRIKELSRQVYERVKRAEVSFRTVGITVRFHDFETLTRAHTLSISLNDSKTLEREALALFLPFLDRRENPKKKLVRLLGVRVGKLAPARESTEARRLL